MRGVRLQGRLELLPRFGNVTFAQVPQPHEPIRLGLPHRRGLPGAELGEEVQFARRVQPFLPDADQFVEKPCRFGFLAQFPGGQSLVVAHRGCSGRAGGRLLEVAPRLIRAAFGTADHAEEVIDLGEPALAATGFGGLETLRILQGRLEILAGRGVLPGSQRLLPAEQKCVGVYVMHARLAFPNTEMMVRQQFQGPIVTPHEDQQ